MSKHNPSDQIDKAAWTLAEGIKDALSANLVAASSRGQLNVKGDVLATLLALVDASVQEGYHRGTKTFMKSVEKALEQTASVVSEPPTKKKTG